MPIEALSIREQQIVFQYMKAVAGLIDESELHSRLGIERGALQSLIGQWPSIDDNVHDSDAFLAINNSLDEICNGLSADEWADLIDVTEDEVGETYRNWLRAQKTSGGIR